jgi:mevalonate kinase
VTNSATASAPGKIIILGEHFVVHGSLAISAAINKRATVSVSATSEGDAIISSRGNSSRLQMDDGRFRAVKAVLKESFRELNLPGKGLKIEIESEIPPGSGLGSSAAVCVATAGALLRHFDRKVDRESVSRLANRGEASVHGNPSGVDVATSLNGGTILFEKTSGVSEIKADPTIEFLVVFTGLERNTSDLVQKVSKVKENFPSYFSNLSESISKACVLGKKALETGDLETLGALMNLTQTSLSWIGTSNSSIESLIEKINKIGHCHGSKLTGAGGGGSVIALPEITNAKKIASEISKEYPDAFLTNIRQEGLRIEQ